MPRKRNAKNRGFPIHFHSSVGIILSFDKATKARRERERTMHGSMDEHETTFKQTRHQTLEFYFFCFSNSPALPLSTKLHSINSLGTMIHPARCAVKRNFDNFARPLEEHGKTARRKLKSSQQAACAIYCVRASKFPVWGVHSCSW